MNVLAIDHGTKRVGLAIGSIEVGTAAPLKVIGVKGEKALLESIRGIALNEDVGLVVVGRPLAEDGGPTGQERIVADFAERLEEFLDLPVLLEDERFSSREIERHMEAMGGRKAWKASGLDRDSAAASLFLQTFLDRLKTQ